MNRVTALIIGGGQAGLAMSRTLSGHGVQHIVLERGRVGQRWRAERWPSLRLLTPRWQSRLPGHAYAGPDPDGYMTRDEVVELLETYADSFVAPVLEGVTVTSVSRAASGFRVLSDGGEWLADSVVIATGYSDLPYVPAMADDLSPRIVQVVPSRYRGPEDLPPGGVLVVGSSSTGVQLAETIHASGRPVTLSVGRHTRLPRVYRGRDILCWFDAMGILRERAEDVPDLERSRRSPSLQLIGSAERRTLDLGLLQDAGVRLVGQVAGANGRWVRFADDLATHLKLADQKLDRTLGRVDAHIERRGLSAELPEATEPSRLVAPPAPAALDLRAAGIQSVVWATGYRRGYPWLHVPVLDARGEIRHTGGITAVPGLYVLGLHFMRRRNSSFLDGVGSDAGDLAAHLVARLRRVAPLAA